MAYKTMKNPRRENQKDCWNTCDYPSECRWGKKYGVQTPVEPEAEPEFEAQSEFTIFTEPVASVPMDLERSDSDKSLDPPSKINFPDSQSEEKGRGGTFWSQLMNSVERRTARSQSVGFVSSRLARIEEEIEETPGLDIDGDTPISAIDPRLLEISSAGEDKSAVHTEYLLAHYTDGFDLLNASAPVDVPGREDSHVDEMVDYETLDAPTGDRWGNAGSSLWETGGFGETSDKVYVVQGPP